MLVAEPLCVYHCFLLLRIFAPHYLFYFRLLQTSSLFIFKSSAHSCASLDLLFVCLLPFCVLRSWYRMEASGRVLDNKGRRTDGLFDEEVQQRCRWGYDYEYMTRSLAAFIRMLPNLHPKQLVWPPNCPTLHGFIETLPSNRCATRYKWRNTCVE